MALQWVTTTRQRSFCANLVDTKQNGAPSSKAKESVTAASMKSTPGLPVYSPPSSGFLALLPVSWVPYAQLMRLHSPGGFYAFYFPYVIGLLYAACLSNDSVPASSLIRICTVFLFGSILLRGAACTWNDNIDQEFDRKVARCRLRPIARGAVSTMQGHIFTVAQTMIGSLLFLQLPVQCTYCAIPITILFAIYPFGKRFTDYPQFILGFPFAGGIVMACYALGKDPLTSRTFPATACLFFANVLWTMIYDTIYAHQDMQDDIKAGVKSMAVRFKNTTKIVTSGLAVAQVFLLVATGILMDMLPIYFIVTCGGTAISLASMISLVDLGKPASCAWWFKWGFWIVGGNLAGGLLGQYFVKFF